MLVVGSTMRHLAKEAAIWDCFLVQFFISFHDYHLKHTFLGWEGGLMDKAIVPLRGQNGCGICSTHIKRCPGIRAQLLELQCSLLRLGTMCHTLCYTPVRESGLKGLGRLPPAIITTMSWYSYSPLSNSGTGKHPYITEQIQHLGCT